MIRKKHYISGRGTRYFQYRSGVVRENRSALITVFVPLMVTIGLFSGGGYFGLKYYQNTKPLFLLAENEAQSNQQIESQDSSFELESFQAKEDEDLTEQIEEAVEDMPENTKWSISVRDLGSGRMANVNADKKINPVGLSKLFILPSLDKRLSSDYWQSFIDYRHSVNDCVYMMIQSDDDSCVNSFGYYVGWDSYNEYNKQLGFEDTILNQDGSNVSTSREVSEMMYRLQNSQALSDKARRLVFDALYDQSKTNGFKNNCPSDCLIGSLISERDEFKHEVAVITKDNARYVVAIMSEGASWEQFEEVARHVDREMVP